MGKRLERALVARRGERVWDEAGWGPRLAWPVPGRESLVFSLRVPRPWKTVDALARPDGEPGSLDQALPALAQGIEAGGVITAQGIFTFAPDDTPVFGTLTAALSDVPGEPPARLPDAEVESATLRVGRGARVRRVRDAQVVPGRLPIPVMTLQYLLRTEHGALALTFATPQRGLFDELAELFDQVVQTCLLTAPGELD
jgi:hypothetical protein